MARDKSYAAWHDGPHHSWVHWAMFIILVLLVGFAVYIKSSKQVAVEPMFSSAAHEPKQDKILPTGKSSMGREAREYVIVKFLDTVPDATAKSVLVREGLTQLDEIPNLGIRQIQVPPGRTPEQVVEQLTARRSQLQLDFAEVDLLYEPTLEPNDPAYTGPNTDALRVIKAPQAWDRTTGSNIIIAGLDSGVDGNHPDLAAHMVPGWNVYNNNADTSDISWHGTATISVAGAVTNNSFMIAAVGWDSKIMPIRITQPDGWASRFHMAKGLDWARTHGAKIANISFGYLSDRSKDSRALETAAKSFYTSGGLITYASGNGGSSTNPNPIQPFSDSIYIMHVGGTDNNDVIYNYSSAGKYVDVVAPADGSCLIVGNYSSMGGCGGTSMSAPRVAGVISLIWSANPNLTNKQVESIIETTAKDLGPAGFDNIYGWGRIDAAAAVNKACTMAGAVCSPLPTPLPTPSF